MSGMSVKHEAAAADEAANFTMDELREFLEADLLDVQADPGFKERLRQKLWALVSERAGGSRGGEGSR